MQVCKCICMCGPIRKCACRIAALLECGYPYGIVFPKTAKVKRNFCAPTQTFVERPRLFVETHVHSYALQCVSKYLHTSMCANACPYLRTKFEVK